MNRRKLFVSTAQVAIAAAAASALSSTEAEAQAAQTPRPGAKLAPDGTEIPRPSPPFKGTIGKTFKELKQDFPQPIKAPKGAPNIVLILLDDVGFGHPGTFGGPIPTPKLDKLAGEGIRYNSFHTTGDLFADRGRRCSPASTIIRSASARSPNCRPAIPATTACGRSKPPPSPKC